MRKNRTTIYDYRGGALWLERGRLIENHSATGLNNWMASYASIREAYKANKGPHKGSIRIEDTNGTTGQKTGVATWVSFYRPGQYNTASGVGPLGVIGCRKFTPRTFNLILKAAGVVKAVKLAKKKALTAKAGL
jgi:hypothetical protein